MKRKAVFLFCSLIAKQEFFRQAQNNKSMGPRTHQQVKSATMHFPSQTKHISNPMPKKQDKKKKKKSWFSSSIANRSGFFPQNSKDNGMRIKTH